MIPTIEDIIKMLMAGQADPKTAVSWIEQHITLARGQAADRAMLAGMVMSGLLPLPSTGVEVLEPRSAAVIAVKYTDALIAELNK